MLHVDVAPFVLGEKVRKNLYLVDQISGILGTYLSVF